MTGLPRTVYSLPVILRKRDLLDRLRDLGKLLEFLLKVIYPDFQVGEGEGSFRTLIDHAFQDPRRPFRSVTERDMVHARLMRNKATHGETDAYPPSETALANGERYLCAAINDLLPHLPPELAAAVQGDPHSVDESLALTEIDQLADPVEKLRALAARLGALLTFQDQDEGNPPYPLGEGEFVPSVKQRLGRHYGKISQVSRAGLESALDLAADPDFGSRTTVDEVKDATLRLTAAVQQLEAGLGLSGESKPSFDRAHTASASVPSPTVSQPSPRSGNSWGATLGYLGLLLLIGGGLALPSIHAYRERVAKEAREVAQRRVDEERARQLQRDSQRWAEDAKRRADEASAEATTKAAETADWQRSIALRQDVRDLMFPYILRPNRRVKAIDIFASSYQTAKLFLECQRANPSDAEEQFKKAFVGTLTIAIEDGVVRAESAELEYSRRVITMRALTADRKRHPQGLSLFAAYLELCTLEMKQPTGYFLSDKEVSRLANWAENPHKAEFIKNSASQ